MKRIIIFMVCALSLIVGEMMLYGELVDANMSAPQTAELTKVVALSIAKIQSVVKTPSDYKLVKVEQLYLKGKYIWRTTFKAVILLPKDPSKKEIGAGGEIFMNIDLGTEQIEVKHGE